MSPGMTPAQRAALQAVRDQIRDRDSDSAGRVWRSMCTATRGALVMLALDPKDMTYSEKARTAWGGFSDEEKLAIGSLARHLSAELAGAGALR